MERHSILFCARKGFAKPPITDEEKKWNLRKSIKRCRSIDYRLALKDQLKNLEEATSCQQK